MNPPTHDPIVAEVRATREKHAARFGYDLKAIFRDIRARQQPSARNYLRFPSRPAVAPTTTASTQ